MTVPGTHLEAERRPRGPALRALDVSKSFLGTRALTRASLEVCEGEVHGLVGENGSGKSTLVKILAGVYQADGGEIEVGGRTVKAGRLDAATSRGLGISVVHQDSPVFPSMSVAENLFVGRSFPTIAGRIQRRKVHRRAQEILERFHLEVDPGSPMAELDLAARAQVAIARELQDRESRGGSALILDEPTSRLNESEVKQLLGAVRRYADDGQSIVLVTHRLDEVIEACDRLTVLRDGQVVATEACAELDRSAIVNLIVGSEVAKEYESNAPAKPTTAAEIIARVSEVSASILNNVSLEVRQGEIVGLAGIDGAGQSELLQVIYGSRSRRSGAVEIAGCELEPARIDLAREHSVEYVPPDRVADASFGSMTVRENLSVTEAARYWSRGRMSRRTEDRDVAELIARFGIYPRRPDALMSNLSGGNQQKVVIARAFRRRPKLLLLDDPSHGVDVGARAQIHRAIRTAMDDGSGALVASSDAEELARLCDRVLVFVDGKITGELYGSELDRQRITTLIHQSITTSSAEVRS